MAVGEKRLSLRVCRCKYWRTGLGVLWFKVAIVSHIGSAFGVLRGVGSEGWATN